METALTENPLYILTNMMRLNEANIFDHDKLYLNMVKNRLSRSNSFESHSKSSGREKKVLNERMIQRIS